MLNLLLNAAEASDESGKRIILRTEPWLVEDGAEVRTIGGGDLAPGCYVRLLVIDQGVGIDKPLLQRMFDPFFSTKGYGRGLGLSASLGIIRQHMGGLTVESQPGVGSTFAVFLPEAQPLREGLSTPASAAQAVLSNGAVLVVDDEPDIREVVAEVLQMQGVHVFTAQNGREGVESFQVHQALIEVIIMDMQMPVMNGAEATKQLLALKPNAHVIITSGFSEETLATAVTAHPSVIFLQKPYQIEKLVEMVRHRLQVGQTG
jgi:CheY-like chemotaxis protein